MLNAWQAKIAPEVVLALPSQTFIVGTEEARKTFNPSYTGILAPVDTALTCDILALQALHSRDNWQWVVIVETAAELREISAHIESPNPNRIVIAVVSRDGKEQCAIRSAALNYLGGMGLVIPTGSGEKTGRAVQLVQRLLHAWGQGSLDMTNSDHAPLLRIWGEPSLSSAVDVIIPPGWDSEGKIRAVADAAGWDFDEIIRDSSWNRPTSSDEAIRLPVLTEAEAMVKFQEEAAKMKEEDMRKEQTWLKSLEIKIATHQQAQEAAKEKVKIASAPGSAAKSKQTVPAHPKPSRAKADFFQRLLGR